MKRFLFVFMAAVSFTVASAQPASDASVILTKLDLENVIFMIPQVDFLEADFNDAGDYLSPTGVLLEDLFGNQTSPFLVFSNRNFNVAIRAATSQFIYTGSGTGNNVMPCSVLQYNLASNGTGGTNATPATWNPISTSSAPLITGGVYGAAKPFSVRMRALPGWSYTGGDYRLGVILTATQL